MDNEEEKKGIRLQVFLSQCGLGSRRKCEELIQQGHVRINQKFITKMGEKVYPRRYSLLQGKPCKSYKEKNIYCFLQAAESSVFQL